MPIMRFIRGRKVRNGASSWHAWDIVQFIWSIMINTYFWLFLSYDILFALIITEALRKCDLPETLEKYPDSQGKHVASSWRMLPDPPIEIIESLTIHIVFSAVILPRSTSTAIALDILWQPQWANGTLAVFHLLHRRPPLDTAVRNT